MPSLKPKTLPKTEVNFEIQGDKPQLAVIDISASLSGEAWVTLQATLKNAGSRGSSEAMPEDVLAILLGLPKVMKLLSGKTEELQKFLQEKTATKRKLYWGRVYLGSELKKIIYGAMFWAKQEGSDKIFNRHIIGALSVYPDTRRLFAGVILDQTTNPAFILPEILRKYATDLSSQGTTTEEVAGRATEVEQIMRVISRQDKHHVLLIGEAGVGKGMLGLALAQKLKEKQLPQFGGARVLEVNAGELFAVPQNTSPDWPRIIEDISSLGRMVIVFDQAAMVSGELQVSMMVGFLQSLDKKAQVNILMPVTPTFYNQHLATNPYFSADFETIKIDESAPDESEKILRIQGKKMEENHQVKIDEGVYAETVTLAKRYLSGKLPQKAITLMEEVCASASLAGQAAVGLDDLRKVVSEKTGIPMMSLTASERGILQNLDKALASRVIGQEEAVNKVSQALKRARAGLKDPRKPIGSFLFLGPTGVGKTELAKVLAREFFNDEKAFLRLDMSEYSESHTAQRLIGSPPGYVGYEEGGQLTNPVAERPYCLILFDEIEKAHPRIFDLFLQVLDEGRLTDSQGKTVDFKNTLLIFTSNIASDVIFDNGPKLVEPDFDRKAFLEEEIMPIVREYFRPEFINRFDDIVLFNPLTIEVLVKIAGLKIQQLNERLKEKNIQVELSPQALVKIVKESYKAEFGARPLERAIREKIENVIAQKIINGEIAEGEVVKW